MCVFAVCHFLPHFFWLACGFKSRLGRSGTGTREISEFELRNRKWIVCCFKVWQCIENVSRIMMLDVCSMLFMMIFRWFYDELMMILVFSTFTLYFCFLGACRVLRYTCSIVFPGYWYLGSLPWMSRLNMAIEIVDFPINSMVDLSIVM